MAAIFDLDRFKSAQDRASGGFNAALSELQAGRKRGHWIWYIFPQLSGLGDSAMSVRYGLQGVAEATAYLRDPLLRDRLLVVTAAVAEQLNQGSEPPTLDDLMGSAIDARKLVSCLTLFRDVARRLNGTESLPAYAELAAKADAVLGIAAGQGLAECAFTRRQLAL
jgi:uncharacterized protein (DUF1810 family)